MKIEEQLEKDGYVMMLSVGDSMEPMLHQRCEQLLIEKANRELKNGDVVLYKRESGQYVLHRIVRNKKDTFVIRGDNRFNNEIVPKKWIIGILKGFYKDDSFIDCEENAEYRLYVKTLKIKYPFKYVSMRFISIFKRILFKIKRKI